MCASGISCTRRGAAPALLAGVGLPLAALALQARFAGMLGQSGGLDGAFIPWTEARWCARDAGCNVYLPGGWMVPRGETTPVQRTVPEGTMIFDGRTMYVWRRGRTEMSLRTLKAVKNGFVPDGPCWTWRAWEWIPAVAPDGQARGLAARAKVVALDARGGRVMGWRADGAALGMVVDFAAEPWAGSACGIAFDPASGDLLISTRWEVRKVFRFGADGREVREEGRWPYPAFGLSLAMDRGHVWAIGRGASFVGVSLMEAPAKRFDDRSYETFGLAWGGKGYWLATSQGMQYFPSVDPKVCRKRIGGLAGVTALAVCKGRVLAVSGYRMHVMWLDDRADEPFESDMDALVGNRWRGVADGIDVADGKFYIRERESGETWCFDPEVTQWVFREKRMFRCDRPVAAEARRAQVAGGVAVAEPDMIVVYGPNGARLCAIPERATAVSAEGRWLIAYVPEKAAVVKYRIVMGE